MKVEVTIPDNKIGNWQIETFTVQDRELSEIMSLLRYGRGVPAGTYKRLIRNGTTVMSNTPDEIRDFLWFARRAHGSVLVNGLGLGVLVRALLDKPDVSEITVIEKSAEVIELVAPHLVDDRLTIIHADAFDYQPPKGKRFNFVWHDIWDNICSDNLPDMHKLHRKYGRRCDYQESWCRDRCERNR